MNGDASGSAGISRVRLPHAGPGVRGRLLGRLALALGLIAFVALVAYIGRDGYEDADGGPVTLLDAFYYATVSVTTTGYGDVRPVSEGARLATTLLVTPARVLFLILLVGTTVEILAGQAREVYRVRRWRRRLRDHVIVCGFGTKGRTALRTLQARGMETSEVVVIDSSEDARREAERMSLVTVAGSATSTAVLDEAGIREAAAVIVATDRDDTGVLITLTARELNPSAVIVSAVREEENAHLLRESGANSVIVSSGAAGRLLGLATQSPRLVEILEDLMTVGAGLDIAERTVEDSEAGPLERLPHRDPVVAIIRGAEVLRFDDPRAGQVQPGDRVVYLCSHD